MTLTISKIWLAEFLQKLDQLIPPSFTNKRKLPKFVKNKANYNMGYKDGYHNAIADIRVGLNDKYYFEEW